MTDRTISAIRTHDDRSIPVPGCYTIDPAHTSVEFIARHLMITKVRGRLQKVSGTITVREVPEHSHVEVQFEAASLSTGNPDRDAHLRGTDFFDVDRFPLITFRSTEVHAGSEGTWVVVGDLMVRSVVRSVTLQVAFEGSGSSPAGDVRIAFSASTDVDREDWGLSWNLPLVTGGTVVGRKVRIEIEAQAIAPVQS